MLSINTNIAGLIAQNSLTTSTDKLNQAIERMTTGLKINHASDNAANYSISTNLTTQLSAYDIAADNVATGMDLVGYASDIISQMQDKAARLNALSTQARNGTYGAQSLSALNSEASAIMAEITRLYNTAEYNDISLFNKKEYTIAPHLPQAGASGFIDETSLISMAAAGEGAGIAEGEVVGTTTEAPKAKAEYNGFIEDPTAGKDQAHIESLNSVSSVTEATGFTESEYKVATVEDLVKLAELTNAGVNTTGKTFYLTADLDLGAHCNKELAEGRGGWEPIGKNFSNRFKGTFDGNGHVIKNLKIVRETSNYQGLFGYIEGGELKNIGIIDAEIRCIGYTGGLVGQASSSSITNSYTTGNVNGTSSYVGGLVGYASSGSISNSYTTGNVTGQGERVGGLAGSASSITNSYATGNVTGQGERVGGLVGSSSSISNSYATGNVSGTEQVGGLIGSASSTITNSYATGTVKGTSSVGGLVGYARCYQSNVEITDSTSYCSVNGDTAIGSLVGNVCCTEITDFKSDRGESIDERTGELLLNNCSAIDKTDYIGGYYKRNIVNHRYTDPDTGQGVSRYEEHEEIDTTFDVSIYNANITAVPLSPVATILQVGIYNNSSCQINFNTNFEFDLSGFGDIQSVDTFDAIVAFENLLSEKATQLGAVQNRLDSALESNEVNINNLTSSRSTIRDADIAEVSSEYIKQQILQQASATLMATANQSPAIALQLI